METCTTPRGTFKVLFSSLDEAYEAGWGLWHTAPGFVIVGKNNRAYAAKNVEYKCQYRRLDGPIYTGIFQKKLKLPR